MQLQILFFTIIMGFISDNKAHKNSRTIKHKKTDGQTDTKEQQCHALPLPLILVMLYGLPLP